ncbi:cytochrome b5 domain-containing protein [Candidatus Peribacteria bacterium]|nr:cytochrome b5 domain-containing protein [Candidatus Peribacteria bacterium]
MQWGKSRNGDDAATTTTRSTTTATTASTTDTTPMPSFTLAQVAEHATEEDCYTTINGLVYDLTAYVHQHPGGDRNILRICGIDGTAAFEGKHGGERRPEQTLAGFEIGTLAQ